MTEAVDHAGGPEGYPGHLQCPQCQADHAEQDDADRRQERRSQPRPSFVKVAFDPILGRTHPVSRQVDLVASRGLVQVDPAPQDGANAVDLRAMRVLGRLAAGVMLAVHGNPLPRHHAGGQPAPGAEKMRDGGMELHAAMCLAAVQIEGHRDDGSLRGGKEVEDPATP